MNILFDYEAAAQAGCVPVEALRALEDAARREFPDDAMLMELHVLRAVNAYVKQNKHNGNE